MNQASDFRRAIAALTVMLVASPTPVCALARHPANTHPVRALKPDAACSGLAADYEMDSKKLARSQAVAEHERTSAQIGDAAILSHATMTMNLMAAHGCEVPASAPSADRYGKAAIFCSLAEGVQAAQHDADASFADIDGGRTNPYPPPITGNLAACDMTKWLPDGAAQ